MEKKIRTIASLSTRSFSLISTRCCCRTTRWASEMRIDHPEASDHPFCFGPGNPDGPSIRYALGRETLEIPAGKLDPGESPSSASEGSHGRDGI